MNITFSDIPRHLDTVTEELDNVHEVMDAEIARLRDSQKGELADKATAFAEEFAAVVEDNALVCAEFETLVKSLQKASYETRTSIRSAIGEKRKRSALKIKTTLKVTLPNGTVIQEQYDADTFAKTIEMLDPEKVAGFHIHASGGPLITHDRDELPQRSGCFRAISGKWFVNTSDSTERKIALLHKVATLLDIDLLVEQAFFFYD